MIKKFYLSILTFTALLCFGTGNAWGETLHLGSNGSALVGCPVYATQADRMYCSQTVYPAASLAAMTNKSITHLTYFLRALNPNGDYSSVQIRLLEVDYDVLATSTGSKSFKSIEGATLVFEGTLPASTTTELEVEFSEPFAYSGGNLLIDVRKTVTGGSYAPSSSSGGKGRFQGTSVSTYVGLYAYGTTFPTTGTPLTYYPDITFTYEDGTPITCPKPSALTQGEVSHNSAAFTWTAGGSETTWQYVYLPAATTLTDEAWSGATAGSVNTAAVELSNLSSATDYKLYVRAYCSSTDQSKNISKAFRTNYAVPFSEDFTGLTSGSIPAGWDNSEGTTTTANYKWVYYSGGHDAAPCVRFNSYNNGSGKTNILKTPSIYVDKAAALSFWYKNPTGGDFSVYYSIDGVKQADALATGLTGAANWTNYEVTLPAECVGHNVQILFQGTSNYGSGDAYIYLDEVLVEAASTCVKPTALNAYATAYNKASVSWTAGGEETSWNLQYSTDNFDTYTSVNGITANPYTLEGLAASTTYKVRIQADCGGAQSGWVVSSAFVTPCEPVNGIGWSEDFEAATAGSGKMPDCWQKITNNNSYPQVSSSSYFQKEGSSKCLYFYGGVTGSSEQIAILPPFTEATNTLYVTLDYSQGYEYYSSVYDYSGDDYGQLSIGYVINSTFTPQESLPRVSAYATASVALTNAPVGSRVAIRYSGGSSSGELFVDNISISAIPSCVAPSGVAGSATAYNQASIAWTVNGTENAWKLQYKATDAENWSAEIDANTNPFTLTGLSANTDYIVQVKALCGGEDVSSWSGSSAPFPTPCQPVDASDYSETMENATAAVGHLPDCWQYREKYGSGIPYVYNGSYYAYAGSQCLYFQGGVDESSEQSVLLPEMDQPLNGLTVEFYYKDAESGWYTYAKFTVGYIAADGTTFVPIETLDYADGYTKYTKDLSALPADAKCLAIRFAGGESTAYGYIDNVRVYPTPTCAAPTGVTVSNVTATTADVAWTENNGATAWKIQLSNNGSTWGDAISVNTNPYQLTGLTPNHTTYYVRVKTVCGENDESPYSEASEPFETECAAAPMPFSETFDNMGCWSKVNCYSSTGLSNGAFRFYYNYSYSEIPPQYLISPEIDTEDKKVTVEFDYYAESGSWPETFQVGYSTTTKEVSAFTWGDEVTATNISAERYSVNLPAGVKYVAIMHTSDGQYYLYIDNFSVEEKPACPKVQASSLAASAITANSATITWEAGDEESAWNLQYKEEDGEWSDAIAVATTPSYTFTGETELAANTKYYVRVQADCAEEGTSEYTDGTFSFETECVALTVAYGNEWTFGFEAEEGAAVNAIPSCWKELPEGHDGYTYALVDDEEVKTGSQCMHMKVYQVEPKTIVLPAFTNDLKDLQISFAYKNTQTSTNYGQLEVGYVLNGVFTRIGDKLSKVTTYTTKVVDMPDNAPAGARIAFNLVGAKSYGGYSTQAYIDDIVVCKKAVVVPQNEDNRDVLAALEGQTLDVQIGRTFFKGVGNNTICLPFSLPTLDGTPLEGGTLLAFKYGYVENGELLLRVYPVESMEAGVPYLISWEDGDNIVDPVFKSVMIAAAQGKSVGENNDVQFVGIFAPEIFPQDDKTKLFMLTNDQIAWSGVEANVANSLKSFRAYFQTVEAVGSNSGSAPIRHGMPARIVKQENSATGFENVQFDAQTLKLIENGNVVIIRNGVKYNIQGQVISK